VASFIVTSLKSINMNRNLKPFLMTVLFCLGMQIHFLTAQYYSFSQYTAPYIDLTNGTPCVTQSWTDASFTVPLDFPFTYFGLNVPALNSFNGFLEVATPNAKKPLIIPEGSFIVDRGYLASQFLSPITYKVVGVPGSQILMIEWKNAGFFYEIEDDNISVDFINYQLWFYEGSNVIEIHYGPMSITQPALCYDGESGSLVGLVKFINFDTGFVSPDCQFLSGLASAPTLITGDSPAILTGTAAPGTVYRFEKATSPTAEPLAANEVQVIPNPANHSFVVNSDREADVQLIDALGRTILEGKTGQILSIGDVQSGTYLVRVVNAEGQTTSNRLVIVH
jgi:Secretion system C-terminal sorting domain